MERYLLLVQRKELLLDMPDVQLNKIAPVFKIKK